MFASGNLSQGIWHLMQFDPPATPSISQPSHIQLPFCIHSFFSTVSSLFLPRISSSRVFSCLIAPCLPFCFSPVLSSHLPPPSALLSLITQHYAKNDWIIHFHLLSYLLAALLPGWSLVLLLPPAPSCPCYFIHQSPPTIWFPASFPSFLSSLSLSVEFFN